MFEVSDVMNKRKRIIVKKGVEFISLKVEEIPLIYTQSRIVYVIDQLENRYLFEGNLMELQGHLDEKVFFRANRQTLININYIKSYRSYDGMRLLVKLNLEREPFQIIISQVTTPLFKKWINEI